MAARTISPTKSLFQFHSFLIFWGAVVVAVFMWQAPRAYSKKSNSASGMAGVYQCGESKGLREMENHRVKIDHNMNFSMVGQEVELPLGTLVLTPGNPKLARLHLTEGLQRSKSTEFNGGAVNEIERHGGYIYLHGEKDGQQIYAVTCYE